MRHHWGYNNFRELQHEAMNSILDQEDSLVVLPTGGGKSLCFQVPALMGSTYSLVISPLISLMKDQVDALIDNGVAAACINSNSTDSERATARNLLVNGKLRLLYVSPERLMQPRFLNYVKNHPPGFIAIDEAHCISMWGHDFRPEYRQLSQLKTLLPETGIHAFTATATKRVRNDIVKQLDLKDSNVFIGTFDRPNLHYIVEREINQISQIRHVIERHKNRPGIIYTIRRADVDAIASQLKKAGYKALPYHAGLDERVRKSNQEAFINDNVDIIVATVAFGMGIDKPDVRYVIHAGLPKSIENYLQESGRAGRDGLKSECVLFYSYENVKMWEYIIEKSHEEDENFENQENEIKQLYKMYDFSKSMKCRHRTLSEYFGQDYEKNKCGACDVCLETFEFQKNADNNVISIIKAISQLGERFGAHHVTLFLRASQSMKIRKFGQQHLAAYGILKHKSESDIRDWIGQLIDQDVLEVGHFKELTLTAKAHHILSGSEAPPKLRVYSATKAASALGKKSKTREFPMDKELYRKLRDLRKEIADIHHTRPFIIMNERSITEMATYKPTELQNLLRIHGIGQSKAKTYGNEFMDLIREYCQDNAVESDVVKY